VDLKEGPLEQFTHEMEPFLRKQGMPVRLNKGTLLQCFVTLVYMHLASGHASLVFPIFTGVVELVSDFVVCEEGKPLSPEASRILVSDSLLFLKSSMPRVVTSFAIVKAFLIGNKTTIFYPLMYSFLCWE